MKRESGKIARKIKEASYITIHKDRCEIMFHHLLQFFGAVVLLSLKPEFLEF